MDWGEIIKLVKSRRSKWSRSGKGGKTPLTSTQCRTPLSSLPLPPIRTFRWKWTTGFYIHNYYDFFWPMTTHTLVKNNCSSIFFVIEMRKMNPSRRLCSIRPSRVWHRTPSGVVIGPRPFGRAGTILISF